LLANIRDCYVRVKQRPTTPRGSALAGLLGDTEFRTAPGRIRTCDPRMRSSLVYTHTSSMEARPSFSEGGVASIHLFADKRSSRKLGDLKAPL
jgi:hypothetical protein